MKGPSIPLSDPRAQAAVGLIEERYVEGVGFANRPGGTYRPDAACWAVMALRAAGLESDAIDKARRSLAEGQGDDGRVSISPANPQACWPTPLAVLAWLGAPQYAQSQDSAIRFLLDFKHVGVPEDVEAGQDEDELAAGWPWIAKTHSWVEPTAYALVALRACRRAEHPRCRQAVRMLIGRQLQAGGWNYGDTVTFGQEMRPMPETTGMALAALAGRTPRETVEHSIAYLRSQWPELSTPISLAWTILGLQAWDEPLERPSERILHVLARQQQRGPYDTIALSLLSLAWHCQAGLVRSFERLGLQEGT